jgi:gliding motility-associated-like protein
MNYFNVESPPKTHFNLTSKIVDRYSITQFQRLFFVVIFLIVSGVSNAQLCQGSLGDPIVDLTFGSGTGTHGNPLPAGMTSYTWSTADFPIDGSYTIENTTAGAGDVWWSTTDHTGDPGGYMMVINASISLTDYFYKNTISGLCPGTVYEFAAWVMNLLRSEDLSPPNITFLIEKTDGTVINSYTTGSIALQKSPLWRQFGFYFSTPAGVTEVVIVMRNNSPGGAPANDLALDDITFRPCGPDISALISETSLESDTVCKGSDITWHLNGTVSAGYSNPEYQWQKFTNGNWQDIPGDTSLNIPVSLASYPVGTYLFRLAVGDGANISSLQCRVLSNEITFVVLPGSAPKYGFVSAVVCANQGIQFIDSTQSSANMTYAWTFGDGGTSVEKDPVHVYGHSGTYNTSLIVTSVKGCKDTATLPVTVQLLSIPTAKFSLTPTDTTILYPAVTFTDESSGATNCQIDWGDGTVTDCSTAQHSYSQPGTYKVKEIVENASGCSDTAFVTVIIRPEFEFTMPNAFTPNGDGLNDIFKPVLFGVYDYSFLVFNRWGEQLFETHDYLQGWNGYFNGKLCPEATYVYKITFRDEVDNRLKVYSGSFILLRN